MSRAVLDTSVFIAEEQDRDLGPVPQVDRLAVSVVTLAELELGVLTAGDVERRSRRLTTLTRARELGAPLPIDERVAAMFASLLAELRERGKSMRVQDAWIAVTALTHDAALCTQDRDFIAVPNLRTILL